MASSTRASQLHQHAHARAHAEALSPHLPPHLLTPKTPDRAADDEVRLPTTPPRPRLRLKRRNLSQLHAPTQQFLASVAAADFAIPSVEDAPPPSASACLSVDDRKLPPREMATSQPRAEKLALAPPHHPREAIHSPPTTPTPEHTSIPSLSPVRYPDWSRDASWSSSDSSSDGESSRPSTSYSTLTDASLFSRLSHATENPSRCGSIDVDLMSLDPSALVHPAARTETATATAPAPVPLARRRKAPWTKAMSKHLWSTYILYMQDPQVTPFRVGRNGIPPAGVCMRVAGEAKRSWKGSRAQEMESKEKGNRERESTPTTVDNPPPPPFIQWPHTRAATRAHLRDLCRATTANPTSRERRRLPLSPTPLGKATSRFGFWSHRSLDRLPTPTSASASASASSFSGNELAVSLAVCTSPSMQPGGPLARLTGSRSEPSFARPHLAGSTAPFAPAGAGLQPDTARTAASSSAQTYGPSCSSAPAAAHDAAPAAVRPRRSHTVGTRRSLGSPVRFSESRTGTHKRRSQKPEAEPRRSKRPSLASDFWVDPTASMSNSLHVPDPATLTPEFCSTSMSLRDRLFVPRSVAPQERGINLQPLIHVTPGPPEGEGEAAAAAAAAATATGSAASCDFIARPRCDFIARPRPFTAEAPPRLGSPFCANSPSLSVPNRHLHAELLGILPNHHHHHHHHRRPFRTIHESVDDTPTTAAKRSLAHRLALIDEHLKAFRRRNTDDRRSYSPSS